MKNVKDLRDNLTGIFEGILDHSVTLAEAKGLTITAGRIISTCKLEIDYAKLNKKEKKIQFLEYETEE